MQDLDSYAELITDKESALLFGHTVIFLLDSNRDPALDFIGYGQKQRARVRTTFIADLQDRPDKAVEAIREKSSQLQGYQHFRSTYPKLVAFAGSEENLVPLKESLTAAAKDSNILETLEIMLDSFQHSGQLTDVAPVTTLRDLILLATENSTAEPEIKARIGQAYFQLMSIRETTSQKLEETFPELEAQYLAGGQASSQTETRVKAALVKAKKVFIAKLFGNQQTGLLIKRLPVLLDHFSDAATGNRFHLALVAIFKDGKRRNELTSALTAPAAELASFLHPYLLAAQELLMERWRAEAAGAVRPLLPIWIRASGWGAKPPSQISRPSIAKGSLVVSVRRSQKNETILVSVLREYIYSSSLKD
ncbi:MAG: hypothetical protein ABIE84_00445 [bacterium]